MYFSMMLILFGCRMIGSLQYWSSIVGLWNLALNGEGQPELPGSNSCNSGNPGCRGVVTVNSDGSYSVNQECESLFIVISTLLYLSVS